jgi:1-acyl-sn-glycerol-3-phosphate acyltransferase
MAVSSSARMRYTIFDTPVLREIMQVIAVFALRLMGWKKEGLIPDPPRCVMIAAPHTSNVDLPITLLLAFAFRVKVYWMGKHSIFKKPFGTIMRWLGGIPVERSKSHNVVEASIEEFKRNENIILIVAPEGTRNRVNYWKSGFYHIANGAGVPISCGFLDYRRKAGGMGPLVMPTGDIEHDMESIQEFYRGVTGRNPAKSACGAPACEPARRE